MSSFALEKWYMDATDDAGQAFIGYAATLRWGRIRLQYEGYTWRIPPDTLLKTNSFSGVTLPSANTAAVQWNSRQVTALWTPEAPAIEETLLSIPDGDIQWSCLYPKAQAEVRHTDRQLSGSGYVEKIRITIPPWKIPIEELHWGRWLSTDHSVAWIRWIGPVPKTEVFFDGKRIPNAVVTQHTIQFADVSLFLTNPVSLRQGNLLSTVFHKYPSLAKLFPKTIMQLQENKWLSEGTLKQNEKILARGKAIHEVVIW